MAQRKSLLPMQAHCYVSSRRRRLLQINTALVSRSADLSYLSPSPAVECYVFPPLITFEPVGTHVIGSVIVAELRPATTIIWQEEGIAAAAAAAEIPLDTHWSSAVLGCSSEYDTGATAAVPCLQATIPAIWWCLCHPAALSKFDDADIPRFCCYDCKIARDEGML